MTPMHTEEVSGRKPQSTAEIQNLYADRIHELRTRVSQAQTFQNASLAILLLAFALFAATLILAWHSLWLLIAVPWLLGFILAVRLYAKHHSAALRAAHRAQFYENGVERLQGNWHESPATGLEFARKEHPYQEDLHILGERSLFTMLCTTRSDAGAERLAAYLLDPASLDETRLRQQAVQELRDQSHLREEIAVLGEYQFLRGDTASIREWLRLPLLCPRPIVSVALALLSVPVGIVAIAAIAQILPLAHAVSILLVLLACEAALALPLRQEVSARTNLLTRKGRLTTELSILSGGLALMQRQQFHSPKLQSLIKAAQASNAGLRVEQLRKRLALLDRSESEWFYLPAMMTAFKTQLILAAERWRKKHASQLEIWLSAWAEFEALNAIAGFAFERPAYAFPQFATESVTFQAQSLGHPLLPAPNCVVNNIRLDASTRFHIISGSNMAGKSTLLRSIGINAVLAFAGAPVHATSTILSPLCIRTSIATHDSLADGKSRFMAEAERLRSTIQSARQSPPVLFLIDEIFSGTNSRDRRVACEALLEILIENGAIGALSTHDLALTEIAQRSELRGLNMHMESANESDPLDFDYLLKPGIATRANAIAILELIGVLSAPENCPSIE